MQNCFRKLEGKTLAFGNEESQSAVTTLQVLESTNSEYSHFAGKSRQLI